MNKKAFSGESVLWIIRIIGTLFAVGILVFLVNGTIEKNLDIEDMRFYPLAERLLYSRNCFILVENDRAMPGIIVSSKFNQEYLDDCMASIDESIGGKITLKYSSVNKELFYNRETYEDIIPLAFSNRYEVVKKRYFVLVQDGNSLIPGNMLVEFAWRK